MSIIMATTDYTFAESSQSATARPSLDLSPSLVQPVRSETWSSSGSFQPLPTGKWILEYHGNCPRCHHHHSSVQVKVNVAPDTSQVSYIKCERCDRQWAAFGVNNSTRISLLSSLTADPDPIDEDVRENLIGIVRRATTGESLGGIAERNSPPPDSKTAGEPAEAIGPKAQRAQTEIGSSPQFAPATDLENPGPLTRSKSNRILGTVRRHRDAHVPMLSRETLKRFFPRTSQLGQYSRRLQKTAVRERSLVDLPTSAHHPTQLRPSFSQEGLPQAGVSNNMEMDLDLPTSMSEEASRYIEGLDRTILVGMSRHDRISWARERYTEFRNRNRTLNSPLAISDVHTITIEHQPQRRRRTLSRQSVDVFRTGGVAEGIFNLTHAIVAEPGVFDIPTSPPRPRNPETERLAQVRRGLRPQSMPNPLRPPPQSPPLRENRFSTDSTSYTTGEQSAPSSTGAVSIRSSAASTFVQSVVSDRPVSQSLMHEVAEERSRDDGSSDRQSTARSSIRTVAESSA